MSVYHGHLVKKTLLIGDSHNKRLQQFCKFNHISESQLLRLLIEELHIAQWDQPLMYNIQNNAFKVQSFLGAYDGNPPIKDGFNDDNGTVMTNYYKKASFPKYKGMPR